MRIKLSYLIMHNYPKNDIYLDHKLKLHKMIDVRSKYDTNGIFNALICINNHVFVFLSTPLFVLTFWCLFSICCVFVCAHLVYDSFHVYLSSCLSIY